MKNKVSIVVPTYNEEKDILNTLIALDNLSYKNKEIIIVDGASKDRTVEIVKNFIKNKGRFALIANKKNKGLSLDRNQGILKARGDILIILNADVILPHNFIEKISKHYNNGFDAVLVESEVINQNKLFPRWIQCLHAKNTAKREGDPLWTEGFSCRKELAINAGLFPYVNRNSAGEDAIFGENLLKAGAKRIVDRTIKVTHYSPDGLKTFWRTRKGRTRGGVFIMKYVDKKTHKMILFNVILRVLFNLIYSVTIILPLLNTLELVKYSNKKYSDIAPFFAAYQIDSLAKLVGKIEALGVILNEHS